MTLQKMKNKEIIKASQDKNRKWILLLAAIYMIIIKILFVFIYQKNFRDIWNS